MVALPRGRAQVPVGELVGAFEVGLGVGAGKRVVGTVGVVGDPVVGATVGAKVVGEAVGMLVVGAVGDLVGEIVVGERVGLRVGARVGDAVHREMCFTTMVVCVAPAV